MRLGMKRRRGGLPAFISVALPLAIFALSVFIAKRLEPAFVTEARSYANTMVTYAIEEAVNETLSNGDYSKTSAAASEGGVTSVEADTVKINRLKSELTSKIQDNVAQKCKGKIYIPLGSASGLYILSGLGPKIPLSVSPAATVNTGYRESFEPAGINQVRHSVNINVDVQMRYSGYMLDECEIINTDVPVLETVIAGAVPNYYGGMGIVTEEGSDKWKTRNSELTN